MSITTRSYTATGSAAALVQSLNLGSTGDVPYVYDCDAPFDFGGSATGTLFNASSANGMSGSQSCLGFRRVLLKTEIATVGGNVKIRVFLKDANGTAGWMIHPDSADLPPAGKTINSQGVAYTIAPVLKTGYFHADGLSFLTHGASAFMVQVVSGTGARSMWYGLA